MNAAQLHLSLTHLPVIGFILFTPILIYAILKRNNLLVNLSSVFIVFLALSSVVVFNSGEGAEEIVEEIPGISHSLIHEHEEAGETAFWLFCTSGFVAALVLALRVSVTNKRYRILFFVYALLTLSSSVAAFYTAHLGGKIRHPETGNVQQEDHNEDHD